MSIKEYKAIARKINKLLFGSELESYDILYDTTINTWADRESSMWFISYSLDENNKIISLEINSIYFKSVIMKANNELKDKIQKLINSNKKTRKWQIKH